MGSSAVLRITQFGAFWLRPHTTNQRMELTAAIKGLEQLKVPCTVKLFSDSAYLINGFTQGWIDNWQRNGWRNSRGEPVKNADLWKTLLELSQKHNIHWIKVKGHSTNKWNNRCDELARQAIRGGLSEGSMTFEPELP